MVAALIESANLYQGGFQENVRTDKNCQCKLPLLSTSWSHANSETSQNSCFVMLKIKNILLLQKYFKK
jgi:hypothetical protein